MGIVKMSVGFGAVLAAAFVLGFVGETMSLFDEFWPGVLLLGALVLLLIVALAVSVGEKVPFMTALIFGVGVGCLTAITWVLGASWPFALELGGRDLNELGADEPWDVRLTMGLIYWGAVGAVLGAACGIAAWALRYSLGQVRSGRERDTREADW